MFLQSLVISYKSSSVQNFAPKFNQRPKKKKIFAALWFYPSSEFRISC